MLYKREYLQQYQLIQQEIERLLAEKNRWERLARQIVPLIPYPLVPKRLAPEHPLSTALTLLTEQEGFYPDRTLRTKENISLWETRIAQQVDGLLKLRKTIDDAIASLPDPECQLVLKYRYIDGLTIEQIANRMHYCERHISRLHESALRAIRLPGCSDEQSISQSPRSHQKH